MFRHRWELPVGGTLPPPVSITMQVERQIVLSDVAVQLLNADMVVGAKATPEVNR